MASVSGAIVSGLGGGGSLGTLFIRIAADSTGLDSSIQQAEKAVTGGATSITKSLAVITAAVVALGAASVVEFAKFESSFAGVRKTINATEQEFKDFASTFRRMATEIPVNVNEINKVAEAAGQLGIQKSAIVGFTRTMLDLGVTTNLASESAAQELARFANITGMSQKDFDRLGSTIVALGNNLATTESDIVSMAMRLAGAGHEVGMTESQILSLAGALSSVGINAEAGGTAISQALIRMAKAVKQGGAELQLFAQVSGSTVAEFRRSFEKDAAGAALRFMEGLNEISKAGGDVFTLLENLNMDGARMTDIITRASGAHQLFANAMDIGSRAWKENNALTKEAEQRYQTFFSQITLTWNRIKDLMITIGGGLVPSLRELNDALKDVTDTEGGLADSVWFFTQKIGPALVFSFDVIKQSVIGLKAVFKMLQLAFAETALFVQKGITGMVETFEEKMNMIVRAKNLVTLQPLNTGLFNFTSGTKQDLKDATDVVAELKAEIAGLGVQTAFNMQKIGKDWEKLNAPIQDTRLHFKKLEKEVKEFDLGEMFATATGQIKMAGDAALETAAKIKAASMATESLLDKLGAPKPVDFQGAPRGLTRAEKSLGSMAGIAGMDQQTLQSLQISTELEENQRKVDELKKLGDQEGQLTEDTQRRKLEALAMFNARAKQLQMAQTQMMMQSFTSIGDSMLQIGSALFGKQTAMYKAMFAASKAFAVAESIVKITQGIASAASLPWPANLAAMASVAAATANIVSTIQATKLEFGGARALGGPVVPGKAYMVGEKGPEWIVPTAPGNVIPNNRSMGGRTRIVVNNYTDVRPEVTEREDGEGKVIEIILRRVKDEMAADVRDGKGPLPRALESSYRIRRGQ